ncbi:MAG TPA: ABC transporter ATP-binding protein, partial [Chloroflexota bacterium]|nr:ABC transporter ATP-binding protein [Chloroflexota bacterium]
LMQQLFDVLGGSGTGGPGLWDVLALLVALELVRVFSGESLSLSWITFLYSGCALLRRNLLRQLLTGYSASRLPSSPGEAVSRFRDDVEEIVASIDAWNDLVGRTIFGAVALVLMLRIDPVVTLFIFVPLAVIVPITHVLGLRLADRRRISRVALGRVTGFLGEAFGAVLAIKVAGAAPNVVTRFRALNEIRRRTALRDHVFQGALDSLNSGVVSVGTGVVLLLAARAMRSGTFTVGDFALFVIYLGQLTWFPDEIARLLTEYKLADVSVERLTTLLGGAPRQTLVDRIPRFLGRSAKAAEREHRLETQDNLTGIAPTTLTPDGKQSALLEARGLTCEFAESDRGINVVDLRIEPGSFTVVTGRVGSGKTTLLEALIGLRSIQAGQLYWDGAKVADPANFFGPPRSAYTPQVPRLFNETLRDNLLLGWPDGGTLEGALES